MAKKKPDDELDTTTSFADMNVDGFRWYDPSAKTNKSSMRKTRTKVSRKEYWAMVWGAFKAIFPFILISVVVFSLLILLAYFWLK